MSRRLLPPDPSVGQRIAARRNMRGWSIRFAASRAGIAHTTWLRIERGELRTDRYVIADLAAVLECSVTDLTGQPYVPGDRAGEAAQARVPALWLSLVEIAPDEPPSREALTMNEFRARMELLDAHRTRSDYAAVMQALPDLLLDLHATTRGPDAREALRMLVDATNTARGTLRGLGRLAESTLAAERCHQIAKELGEAVPLAVADWARANTAAGAGSYRRCLTLATRAANELSAHLDDDGALAMLGMLHLTCGLSVVASDPAEAFAHFDEAAQLADRTGETQEWWMFFGPANVGIWRMGAHVDAKESGRAIELAAALNVGALQSADRRATYYLELARGLSDAGGAKDAAATRALMTAERLAPQRIRAYTTARETARLMMGRAPRTSPLYGLCERMGVTN